MADDIAVSVRKILHALADDTRLEMVRRLDEADTDLSCGALYDGLAKSTASYHFALLRAAGVLTQYVQAGQKLNHLEHEAVEQIAPGVLGAVLHSLRHTGRSADRPGVDSKP